MFGFVRGLVDVAKVQRLGTHQRGIALLKAFRQAERNWLQMIEETNSLDVAEFMHKVQQRHPQVKIERGGPKMRLVRVFTGAEAALFRWPFTKQFYLLLQKEGRSSSPLKEALAHEMHHLHQFDQPIISYSWESSLLDGLGQSIKRLGHIGKKYKILGQQPQPLRPKLIRAARKGVMAERYVYKNGLKHCNTTHNVAAVLESDASSYAKRAHLAQVSDVKSFNQKYRAQYRAQTQELNALKREQKKAVQ